jgi:hypothetical protein
MTAKITAAIGVLACAMWMLGASPAFAGEVNGKGDPIPGGAKGKSACSFSGQQDDPEEDEGFFRGDRVQSWGQIPLDEGGVNDLGRAFLTMIGLHPGQACNPTRAGGEP